MKSTKKLLSMAILVLLVVGMGGAIPVKADTDISVYTVGDVNLTVVTINGTINLIYNDVNIQAEINDIHSSLYDISYRMRELATKTDLNNLNQTVFQLIGELDVILEDLFGKTNFLANVIGLNSNTSVISENLMSGNYTIVSYLDSIIATLDDIDDDVNILSEGLTGIYAEVEAFESYVEGQFNAAELEIKNLADYTEEQRRLICLQITTLEVTLETSMNAKILAITEQTETLNAKILVINEQTETLRQNILNDLITLESSILDETNRQDITETYVQKLQKRLYDLETAFNAFILIAIVLAVIICLKKVIKRKPKTPLSL